MKSLATTRACREGLYKEFTFTALFTIVKEEQLNVWDHEIKQLFHFSPPAKWSVKWIQGQSKMRQSWKRILYRQYLWNFFFFRWWEIYIIKRLRYDLRSFIGEQARLVYVGYTESNNFQPAVNSFSMQFKTGLMRDNDPRLPTLQESWWV